MKRLSLIIALFGLLLNAAAQQWVLDCGEAGEKTVLYNGILDSEGINFMVGAKLNVVENEIICYHPFFMTTDADGNCESKVLEDEIHRNQVPFRCIQLNNGNYFIACEEIDTVSNNYNGLPIHTHLEIIILNQDLEIVSEKRYDIDTIADSFNIGQLLLDDDGTVVLCGSHIVYDPVWYPYRPAFYRFDEEGNILACRYAQPDEQIGEQTAMDEAKAWQFAANAPGTKDFVKSKIDGTEGYTIAYTARVMSTGWVAKMLKEGQPNPTFQQHHPEWYQGEIEKYRGEVMNMAYPSLKEGSGYGLSYHENNLNLLANWSFALKDVKLSNPPESLIFGRDGLIHMKSNKEPYTGTVVGNIVCPYGKTGLKKRDFLFYEKFGSYDVLACNAAFYEMGMFRIAFGHYINVDGAISDGKEEGHWQYRYIYGDKDFLIVTANYKDGKLDGLAEFFKEDGRKYQECEFEKGVLKLRIWYNESGEIIYRDTYENGELKKTEQFAKDPRNF